MNMSPGYTAAEPRMRRYTPLVVPASASTTLGPVRWSRTCTGERNGSSGNNRSPWLRPTVMTSEENGKLSPSVPSRATITRRARDVPTTTDGELAGTPGAAWGWIGGSVPGPRRGTLTPGEGAWPAGPPEKPPGRSGRVFSAGSGGAGVTGSVGRPEGRPRPGAGIVL